MALRPELTASLEARLERRRRERGGAAGPEGRAPKPSAEERKLLELLGYL